MNAAAAAVAREIPDVVLAYGASDEFSFAFWRGTVLFERRARYASPPRPSLSFLFRLSFLKSPVHLSRLCRGWVDELAQGRCGGRE